MANEVQIIVSAVDKASAVLKKTDGATQSLGKTLLATAKAAGVMTLAYKGFDFLKDAVSDTVAYAKSVRELTQATGLGAEEISRIVQVGDDWGITIEQLRTSLGMMQKNGVLPSINNLADLADEYVNTADKTAFAEKASKLLGRQWQTLIPLLAKGGQAFRDQADAIEDGLIVTDEAIKQAREYEVALDEWNDSILAMKISLGSGLIPALTKLIDLANSPNADSAADVINQIFQGTFLESGASKARRAAEDLAVGINSAYYSTRDYLSVLPAAITSTGGLSEEFKDYEGAVIGAADATRQLAKDEELAASKAAAAKQKIGDFLDIVDRDVGSPIAGFIKDLEWVMAGGGRINAAFEALQEGLASGKITPAQAEQWASELYVATTDLQLELDQIDAKTAADNLQDTLGKQAASIAMNEIKGTQGIMGALQAIQDTEWDINFRFNYSGTLPPGFGGPGPSPTLPGGGNYTPSPGIGGPGGIPGVEPGDISSFGTGLSAGRGDMFVDITINAAPGMSEAALADSMMGRLSDAQRAWASGGAYAG